MKRLLRNKANYAVLEGLRYLYMVANDPDADTRVIEYA